MKNLIRSYISYMYALVSHHLALMLTLLHTTNRIVTQILFGPSEISEIDPIPDLLPDSPDCETPLSQPQQERKWRLALANANSYSEWIFAANELDACIPSRVAWKDKLSDSLYDYKLIAARVKNMRDVQAGGSIRKIVYYLQSGLMRGIGGILDKRLYNILTNGSVSINTERNLKSNSTWTIQSNSLISSPDGNSTDGPRIHASRSSMRSDRHTATHVSSSTAALHSDSFISVSSKLCSRTTPCRESLPAVLLVL